MLGELHANCLVVNKKACLFKDKSKQASIEV